MMQGLDEIERVLSEHPVISQAVVQVEDDGAEQRLVAYVVPAQGAANVSQGELVGAWQQLFEFVYRRPRAGQAAEFRGWTSAYTGAPIADEHMREWADRTVERLQALGPRRVLELGCGTGLLLERLAPTCERYMGTDLSAHVLRELGKRVAAAPSLRHVELLHRAADDLSRLSPSSFDTIILNSVVQYFPSADYLMEVLIRVADLLTPAGVLFVGDVRSLPLLRPLSVSIELQRAEPAMQVAAFAQSVRRRNQAERELVLAPAFFSLVASRLPRDASACVLLKRGRHDTEMNRFRYDVLLHRVPAPADQAPPVERTWTDRGSSPADVAALLMKEGPEVLLLRGVTDGRVLRAVQAAEWLLSARGTDRVSDLHAAISESQQEGPGVDPEVWWALGAAHGYAVAVGGASLMRPGRYDVAFARREDPCRWLAAPPATATARLATNPLLGQQQVRLEPVLRTWLRERLPAHMVPSTFILLDEPFVAGRG